MGRWGMCLFQVFYEKLNAGLYNKLVKDFRSKENTFWIPDRKINDNMWHLREIIPHIYSSLGYTWPLNNKGFHDPGKVQFLAALEYYKPGTPRTFGEISCYHCGKIQSDLGKALSMCSRCKVASYCSQYCQKAHWKAHKPSCFDHKNPSMWLNV